MAAKSNGAYPASAQAEVSEHLNTKKAVENPGSGTIAQNYPDSSIARLLDSDLAHKTLKYGVETLSFAVINLFFPKRTSWVARVALPLAVNYVLGKWIEENYDEWVATLAERESQRNAGQLDNVSGQPA
jgi:hypothetical protein